MATRKLPKTEVGTLTRLGRVSDSITDLEKQLAALYPEQQALIVHAGREFATPDRDLMRVTGRSRATIARRLQEAGVRRWG